jgi:high-affinity nickel-transport protein
MTGLLAIVTVGFVLGMRHACDADHVVAVSTIVARHRSIGGAALVGMVWGVGHTITIMIVGAAIIIFSVAIPPRLALSLEMSVGVMLTVLGAMNLSGITHRLFHRLSRQTEDRSDHENGLIHSHAHSHGGHRHSHPHVHLIARGHQTLGTFGALRALAVGIVHGLAGSAAIALLVLSTIHDPLWSAIYLGVFGVGTIAGMMLISISMAVPFALSSFSTQVERSMVLGSGLLSLGFGIFLMIRIGFWERLF